MLNDAILDLRSSILDYSRDRYCAAPTGAIAMSTIGVFTLSVLTSVALPVGRYFIQTFILRMNMDNWYNLPALNHPTKRSDKAFPSEAAWR